MIGYQFKKKNIYIYLSLIHCRLQNQRKMRVSRGFQGRVWSAPPLSSHAVHTQWIREITEK